MTGVFLRMKEHIVLKSKAVVEIGNLHSYKLLKCAATQSGHIRQLKKIVNLPFTVNWNFRFSF